MVMQRLSFLAAFIKYLEKEELITREEAAKSVGGELPLRRDPIQDVVRN